MIENKIKQNDEGISVKGTITLIAKDAKTGQETFKSVTSNLIMVGNQRGKDILVQYLLSNGLSGGINYGAIGTGTTPAVVTDTQLTAEVARVGSPVYTDSAFTTAKIAFYFPDAVLANQTYNEFGTFAAGTATANSGNIFNHALFASPYAKTAGNNTTVEVDIAFT